MRKFNTRFNNNHSIVRLVLAIGCISFFFSINGYAQIDIESINSINKKCHEDGPPTTATSMNCEKSATEMWNTEIKTYLELLEKEELVSAELLAQQQKAWLNFYTTSVKLQSSYLGNYYEGGTMAWVAIETFKKQKVKERALDLADFYQTIIED